MKRFIPIVFILLSACSAKQPAGDFMPSDLLSLENTEAQQTVTVGTASTPASLDMNFGHIQANFNEVYSALYGLLPIGGTAANSSLLEGHSASYFQPLLTNPIVSAGTQDVTGVKNFTVSPIVPTPTTDMQAAPRKFVLDNAGAKAYSDLTGTPSETVVSAVIQDFMDSETAEDARTAIGAGTGGASTIGDISDWPSGLTATELGSVDGATSNIQAQIDSLQSQITALQSGWDTVPTAFSFTALTDVALSSVSTSGTKTLDGTDHDAPISIDIGEYQVAGGSFTSATGTIAPGATFAVRHTNSASYSTPTTSTLNIGGVTAPFTSTTLTNPSGATVLLGDPSLVANTEMLIALDDMGVYTDSLTWDVLPATASGKLGKGYTRLKESAGSACKMIVFNSSGVKIEESAPVSIIGLTTLTDVEFTFAGTADIVSGTGYIPACICNQETIFGNTGVGWTGTFVANNYNTVANFTPATDIQGNGTLGQIKMWITTP